MVYHLLHQTKPPTPKNTKLDKPAPNYAKLHFLKKIQKGLQTNFATPN